MTQFKVDFNDFKRRDNTNLMEITLYKDNGEQITPNRDHQWSGKAIKFGDGDKRLDQELAVTLDDDKIGVPSKQLENLPSGDYGLELWEVSNDSKTIYPSAGFIEFHIHRNADESLESVTPTTDINKVIDDLHQAGLNVVVDDIEMLDPDATPSVTSEVRDGKNHIKLHIPRGLKGDQGDKGDTGTVDNAGLTTAPAFVALQTQVNNSAVGTNLLRNSVGKFQPNRSKIDNYIFYTNSTVYMTQGQQYTVHANASDGLAWSGTHNPDVTSNNVVLWLSDNKNVAQIISDATTGTRTTFTWNHPSGTYFIRVNTYKPDNSGYVENIKIEKGNTATPWCPNPSEILTQSDYAKIKAAIVALGGSLS